ncbi:MAG: sigma-70 family RNA polymerase sigma factor [Bacteroidales bacterium]|nr:sigma-70 family RNA polymerase sigma factor [Bacteroidales bacterium]
MDQKIIEDVKKGKRHAQNMLYKHYAPSMLGICMRYAKSRDEAEDMAQEGFIKIFTGISGFRGEGSFEGWMKRIMVNTAITYYKSNLKHQYHSDVDEINETLVNEDEDADEDDDVVNFSKAQLMSVIQGLPEGYRMVFNLYVFEQYAHKDIADTLGISVNTSKSQLSKARRMLVSRLSQISRNKKIAIA